MSDPKRVLIADDSNTVTTVLKTALETEGYIVEAARNGPQAYELGKSGTFDLVVLDQLMPGMLGIEVIEKWHSEGIETPVLMLSGVDDDRTVVESLESGAIDFVRKPFQLPELLARIKRSLKN